MRSRPPITEVAAVLPAVLVVLVRLRWLHPRSDMRTLVGAVTVGSGGAPMRPSHAQTAVRLAGAIVRRLPRVFPQACLYWSLAGCHFLRRAGRSPVIHVGVRLQDGEMLSHAWLTVDGEVLVGQPDPDDYTEMLTFPDRFGPSP